MMGYATPAKLAVVAMTIFCGASCLAAPQSPEPDHSQTPLPKDTKANEAPRKDEITYVPPDLGAPAVRVSGGTRGTADAGLSLDVLAPNQTGLTTQEQPTLYWYISRSIRADIRLSIVEDTSNDTVLDVKVPGGATAGIHAFSLKGTRLHLALNTDYQWSITAVRSQDPSEDIVAVGMIRRVRRSAADRDLRATSEAAADYAHSGLGYDALQALSEAIRARSNDLGLQDQRSALLHQVGLAVPAAQDRSSLR